MARTLIRIPRGGRSLEVAAGGRINIADGAAINVPTLTPVNAVAAKAVLAAADLAITADGDKVLLAGDEFVKDAAPGAGEWANAAGLAVLLGAVEGFDAAEAGGAVTVTAETAGVSGNGTTVTIESVEDTTAGGDGAGTEATATIAAGTIARLAVGDTVEFDGETFTKAAVTSVPDGEFADQAGLIACIDGLDDWLAADNAGAIDITAATDSADFNGIEIVVSLFRITAGGIDGTEGKAGDHCQNGTNYYVCTADNTVADANWKLIALTPY